MRVYLIALTCLLVFIACDDWTPVYNTTDGGIPIISDLKCPPLPDLAPPTAKCTAGKGLAGDNLLCVDFAGTNAVPSVEALRAMGWIVSKDGGTSQEQWEISGGVLQVKGFSSFASTASITLPQADLTTTKYSSITLVLRHKVDLDLGIASPNQLAQIYFGTANPALLITETSGTQVEQQLTITVDKQKFPASINNVVKFLLQASALTAQNKQGWQISSIAVMANQ